MAETDRPQLAAQEERATSCRPRIHRYVLTMLGDVEAAEDLVQECMRRVFDKLHTVKNPDRLESWIFAIAVNLCREHLRRLVNSRTIVTPSTEQIAARHSALSSVLRRECAEVLAVALDRLPILLREAFVLHVVEGLSYAAIAKITGASIEALQVRKHRAISLLRRQLGSVVDTFWSE